MYACNVATTSRTKALKSVERAIDIDFCAALAEPTRLSILVVLLRQGTSDVGSVAVHLSQDRSVVSRHLKHLHQVGLVRMEKDGRQRLYTLDGRNVLQILEGMAGALREAMACCCPEELR